MVYLQRDNVCVVQSFVSDVIESMMHNIQLKNEPFRNDVSVKQTVTFSNIKKRTFTRFLRTYKRIYACILVFYCVHLSRASFFCLVFVHSWYLFQYSSVALKRINKILSFFSFFNFATRNLQVIDFVMFKMNVRYKN